MQTTKKMTHHDYLTKMASKIIDDDAGKELNYRQLSKHPKHQNIWNRSFANKIGRISQGAGGRVEVKIPCYSLHMIRFPNTDSKTFHMGAS